VVDVDHDQRQRRRVALAARDLGGTQVVELAPVEEAGKSVAVRVLRQGGGELVALALLLGQERPGQGELPVRLVQALG
jgi:hypothetical protein